MGREGIQEIIHTKQLEGVLIFTPENVRYLSGFSGGEGCLLARETENLLMVDARYITQAQEEAKGCHPVLVERGIEGVAAHVGPLGLQRVGFEAAGISVVLFDRLQERLKGVELIPVKDEMERMRGIKASDEITLIKGAIDRAEGAWKKIVEMAKPGAREDELALELEYAMRRAGCEGVAFELIVPSGPRTAFPHAPQTPRKLTEGDFVLFDFGGRYHGYTSDETCTLILGRATQEQRRIYQIVKEAHDKAIEKVRPGVRLAEVDAAARVHIGEAGHGGHFGHGTGHGIGLAVHEWPVVGKDSPDVAEEGMVFTIEPGIYIPDWGGVRIEDMVLVTAGGCEVLTTISKDLMILG